MNGDSQRLAFEHHRLELFKSHGFEASAAWFSNSDGPRTAAVVGGERERPVVLIHGMLNDAGEWALIAGKLSGRLLIPDWPGCGLSDAVPIRPVGFRRFGVELKSLGFMFFLSYFFAALSFLAAPVLARQMGVVKTMAFSHGLASLIYLFLPSFGAEFLNRGDDDVVERAWRGQEGFAGDARADRSYHAETDGGRDGAGVG